LPVGGFVKIEGMTPLEELAPGDESRAFWRFPARQRVIVLAAGSFMHFVLAFVLVYGVVLAAGIPEGDPPVIGAVSSCVPKTATGTCSDPGAVAAPAAHVLQPNDRILSLNGKPVSTWPDVATGIRNAGGGSLTVVLRRHGETKTVELQPVLVTRPSLVNPKQQQRVGAIGVYAGVAYKHFGPVAGASKTGSLIGQMFSGTYGVLTHKLHTLDKIYSKHRDPTGFVGVVGISRVSGDILSLPQESFGHRLADFLGLVAGVNLFVGVFNLLPLLPLDGGHLAIAGFEETRHRVRRWRGYRGEMRRVDFNKLMPITYAFVVLIVGLTIYIAGADIVNPIRLTQ